MFRHFVPTFKATAALDSLQIALRMQHSTRLDLHFFLIYLSCHQKWKKNTNLTRKSKAATLFARIKDLTFIFMTLNENSLLAVERQRMIVEILKREGAVRTAELCEALNVSAVTIRSDLRELEKAGECKIIWGGAVSQTPPTEAETLLDQRLQLNTESKRRIGAKATELIENGQTLILDAGTTTVEIINALPRTLDYLRVITPALNVALAATNYPYIELVMPGGVLRNLTRSLIGPQALKGLEDFNADWTFIASGGFDIAHGVTTSNIMEVEIKRMMVKQASRVALVADGSKFGNVLSLNVAPLTQIDVLITDFQISAADVQAIQAIGVEVLQV